MAYRSILFGIVVLGFVLAGTAQAAQVHRNSTFTSWPHGSPIRGAYGGGNDTAAYWMSKWNKSRASVAIASKLSSLGGYHYVLRPDPTKDWPVFSPGDGGETFYLRQYYRPISASANKRYRAQIVLMARTEGVRGGWYIYAHYNTTQAGRIVNTATQIALPLNVKTAYTWDFQVPPIPAGTSLSSSAGLATAFLFTTPKSAIVDVYSFTLTQLP